MAVTVSLRDFLSTGNFGPLTAAFTRDALEGVLGPPEGTGGTSRKHRRPIIWKYGDLEFYFDRQSATLCTIFIDQFTADDRAPQGWGGLRIEPWIVREGLPQGVFLAGLRDLRSPYTVRSDTLLKQDVVCLSSGVEVGFIVESEPFSPPVGLAYISRQLSG
jgi:hypothetical protein